MSIEAHSGLRDEIIEIYQSNREQTADVLLATLNGPARTQQRGFHVTPAQLVAVIVDSWRINDGTRFVLYDIDGEQLAAQACYHPNQRDAAVEHAEELGDDVIVLRMQLP